MKEVTWEDLSRRLSKVLDLVGVKYEVIPLRCGDELHCADSFHIKVKKARLSLPCIYGDVYGVGEAAVHVHNNKYGVPVYEVRDLGGLNVSGEFSDLCMTRKGIRLSGPDGYVELELEEGGG